MADTVSNLSRSPLVLTLFGPCEVRVHGRPLPRLRSRKGLWLLALLTLRHGAEVERSWLAGLLWPDSPERQALGQLRNSLADLRVALGPEAGRLHSPTPRTLLLDLDGAEVDVVAFDAAIRRGDAASLEEAVTLYRGPLLEGGTEEWMFQERQPREQAFLAALESLARQARERAEFGTAVQYLRRVIGVDATREGAQRGLMEVLAASGNYAAAIVAYRELRERLLRELNAVPDAVTSALFERLREEARRRSRAPHPSGPAAVSPPSDRPPDRPLLPQGTVTFLFTDIEGSTRLWEQHPEAMQEALARHDTLMQQAIEARSGTVFKTVGDQFCAVFATVNDALGAALAGQRALQAEPWGAIRALRVRMALHTGVAQARGGDYFGPPLNRVARLLDAGHGGQILLSQATAELVRDALPETVTLCDLRAHRLKDLQQPEHLFQVVHPELVREFPPLRSLEAFAHNLPRQLTSFIGRERALGEVKELLTTTSLLTLTGAGGCGKTRVALQVAADLLEEYANGVWLVELGTLADPSLVSSTVAMALGLREDTDRPASVLLADYLRSRTVLLVLDNCEHLITASAQLAEGLLQSCPNLRLLATSREPLGIAGEIVWPVPCLSLPESSEQWGGTASPSSPPPITPSVDSLLQCEAIRLFVDRARAVQPRFTLTEGNAFAVAQVCCRLDGIPLAVELAAARARVLPPDQIAARLDDRFRLLTGGSRTALPRQQTLQAAIDWSYNLLSEAERALLRRLSVFVGGWTLEAAEAVCAEGAGTRKDTAAPQYRSLYPLSPDDVLDLLAALVDKSLVMFDEHQGEARYRLLESVRQYGWDRLREEREVNAIQERHRSFFLTMAEQSEVEMFGAGKSHWLNRLETEHDNLRAALDHCEAQGDLEVGLRMAAALARFWTIGSHGREGYERLTGLLSLPDAACHGLPHLRALTHATFMSGLVANVGWAEHLSDEGLAVAREIGDRWCIAAWHNMLGTSARLQGRFDLAQSHYDEALTLSHALGDRWLLALGCRNRGTLALLQNKHEEAAELFESAVDFSRQFNNVWFTAGSLESLGRVAQHQGNSARAAGLHEEALALYEELGNTWGITVCLDGLAGVAAAQGDPERAARLLGAEEALRTAMGVPLWITIRADHERHLAAARAVLSADAFAAAWAEGRAMSVEQALAYALRREFKGGSHDAHSAHR